ncbi:MAG TPA: NAD(+) diphosphatase [Myxococcales bacterium]
MFLPVSFTPLWSAPASSPPGGLWFVLEGGRLLTSAAAGQADALTVPEGDGPPIPVDGARCIGLLGEVPCWAAWARSEAPPPGFTLEPLRRLFDRLPDELVVVAGRAAQALEFDRTHRHCGVCATTTEESDGGRARCCPACGEVSYPRLAPAMMVLVTRQGPGGRELLLASGARSNAPIYSALAGFVEPSESLEDCVRREVDEEVGLRVRGLRYFGSECWPFPHSLMVAFLAEYAGGEIHCQEGEIADAQWFPAGRLPALPHRLSVARRLIDHAVAEAER